MQRAIFLIGLIATTLIAHAAPPTPAATQQAVPTAATSPAAHPAEPVFDCYRMNSAWGFMLAGAMIDSTGAIYRYRIQGKPWAPTPEKVDGKNWLRAADLQAKFANAKQDGSVDAKALQENSALIVNAASGTLKSTDAGARDAGTSTCHAYIHDAVGQRYRDVELGSDGGVADSRMSNDAAAAQTLLAWLKSVNVATK
ncbi:MAG: hypothetical protein ABI304_01835 [Rudaea sp.]